MAKLVKLEALDELGLDEPNILHIQESYLRQIAHAKPFTAKKKRKSDVAGTGAKIFRQKGTGRARQGERRNPHMTGGGLAFAPQPRVPVKRLNKRVRVSALRSAVLWHIKNGSAFFIEGADFDGFTKTKQVFQVLSAVPERGDIALVIQDTVVAWRSSRNLGDVRLLTPSGLNVRDLVDSGCLVFSASALQEYKDWLNLQWLPGDAIEFELTDETDEVVEEVAK